jgi:hypothetical protein
VNAPDRPARLADQQRGWQVDDARVVLRPRSLPDTIDLTLRVCHSAHARAYAVLASLTLLPAYALCLWLHQRWAWAWGSVWVVAVLLVGVLQGVFTIAAGRLLFSEKLAIGGVLRRFVARVVTYSATLVVLRALPALTMVLLPVVLMFPFIHEAVLLEDSGLMRAVTRSQRLTKGSGAVAFELGMLILLTQALAICGMEIVGHTLAGFVFEIQTPLPSLWEHGGSPFALAGLFAAAPYVATLRFLTYIDLRTRKEGWDLQLQLASLRAREEKS